ncbi:MAG: kinase/pyrophosphorylase [Planctomycetes bacterium]|nr:kinase/pyrophosphorylase [Planctomycetota bacterium]
MLSDATGATAQRIVRAALAQFGGREMVVDLVSEVTTVEEIRRAVKKTAKLRGLIAYTLVETGLRSEIASLANEAGVATVDLLGPLMSALGDHLTAEPAHKPGLFRQPGEEHYQRLEAVSYAVRHDDGQCLHELPTADIVIVGPSRTAKTPISVYLAHTRGLKVANVPLALGLEPPEELKALPPRQVVGLTMNANVLSRIREERLKQMGSPDIEYAGLDHVKRELERCHEVYRRPPAWAVIDVTGKSIEEIAGSICAAAVGGAARG